MTTTKHERSELVASARNAMRRAYAGYSGFRVGAALMTESGEVFEGCNVENSSYGLTMCAERNAVFQAVAHGKRKFRSIAIASDDAGFLSPCGACCQVLAEFNSHLEIILTTASGKIKVTSLHRLFPVPPDLKKLSRRKPQSAK